MCENSGAAWLAESLRLTAFTQEKIDPDSLRGSWKTIIGDEPEKQETKPRARTIQESGTFLDATLTFAGNPHRIDWIANWLVPSPDTLDTWDRLGRFADHREHFVELMVKWLPTSPELKRLAFGAVLLDPVDSRNDGYRKVSGYIPFAVDLDSRNFLYQINRRRDSQLQVPDLEINRLSKWSCMQFRTATVLIGEAGTFHDESEGLSAVRLEIDVNTVPEYTEPLDPSILVGLFKELVLLGSEIAEKGDIP